MRKLFYCTIVLFLFINLIGCSNDETIETLTSEHTKEVTVKNGILCFKDSTSLKNLCLSQVNLKPEEIKEWEKSIGFESYNSLYNQISDEYYEIINSSDSSEIEKNLNDFMSVYRPYIYNSGKEIEGVPDYTIEPLTLNPELLRYISKDGQIIINEKLHNLKCSQKDKELKNLKVAPLNCSKKVGARKMTILYLFHTIHNGYGVVLWSSKKTWLGWVNYKATLHWEFEYIDNQYHLTTPWIYTNKVYSRKDVKNGDWTYLMYPGLTSRGKVWNSGVDENYSCPFNTPW